MIYTHDLAEAAQRVPIGPAYLLELGHQRDLLRVVEQLTSLVLKKLVLVPPRYIA